MSFYREQPIKATRKPHRCGGCGRTIDVGSGAVYCAGHNDGQFWDWHYHPECRVAELAYNEILGWQGGDDWSLLTDIEDEDRPWLRETHPEVFARLFPLRTHILTEEQQP